MIIDLPWFEDVVAGFGWGLVVGFVLGVRWLRAFVRELADDEDDPRKKG